MRYISTTWVTCDTVADITETFVDPNEHNIVVKSGTYDFSNGTLVIAGDRRIKFIGDVTFQNLTLQTKCANDTNFYSDYTNSECYWDGVDSFDRNGGASWSGDSTWKIFVRDAWYDIASVASAAIVTVQAPVASGLDGTNYQRYVLCVPDENLFMEGKLTLDGLDAGVDFFGLANSSLDGLDIIVREEDVGYGIRFRHCASVLLPAVRWEHSDMDLSSASVDVLEVSNCLHAVSRKWFVGDITSDENNTNDLVGIKMNYCQDVSIVDLFVSGINRTTGTADATGVHCDYGESCRVEGHVVSIVSGVGDDYNYQDTNGTNNSMTIIAR